MVEQIDPSRRRVLKGAGVAVGAMVIAGCGGPGEEENGVEEDGVEEENGLDEEEDEGLDEEEEEDEEV